MVEVLVGFVVGYDTQERRARVRVRSGIEPGDLLHIAGARTDRELRLKDARLLSSGPDGEVDVIVPRVEPGDMVFRVVGAPVPAMAGVA